MWYIECSGVLHRVTARVVYELWGVTQGDCKSGV